MPFPVLPALTYLPQFHPSLKTKFLQSTTEAFLNSKVDSWFSHFCPSEDLSQPHLWIILISFTSILSLDYSAWMPNIKFKATGTHHCSFIQKVIYWAPTLQHVRFQYAGYMAMNPTAPNACLPRGIAILMEKVLLTSLLPTTLLTRAAWPPTTRIPGMSSGCAWHVFMNK